MATMSHASIRHVEEKVLFMPLPRTTLLGRLGRELAGASREFTAGPGSYLSAAFFPDKTSDWFPLRFLAGLGYAFTSPVAMLKSAASTDEIGAKRRRKLIPALTVSAAIHGTLIVYLIYLMFFSQFAGLRLVNRGYKKFNPNDVEAKLYYPAQIIRQHELDNLKKLDEIRAEEAKRREEAARREKERLEKERLEKEKKAKEEADRLAKEEMAKAKPEAETKSTDDANEINLNPIKDMAGELYALYKAGELELGPELNFSMMATFKIKPDGSVSNFSIVKNSPSKKVDLKALELLHMLGESHALSALKDLSSGSIKLDLNDNVAKLTITAFAATADEAKKRAQVLNFLFAGIRMVQKNKGNNDVAELLSMLKVRSDNNRLDADLTVPRARANEMFRNKFGGSSPQ